MVKTKNFKKNLGKWLLAGALALSLAVPTFAAVDAAKEIDMARASSPYKSYDVILYNGEYAYSPAGANTSLNAAVEMSNYCNAQAVDVYTCTCANTGNYTKISNQYPISRGDLQRFTNAANYPNQSIRARFYKTGIKGGVNIDGKFYYNGL